MADKQDGATVTPTDALRRIAEIRYGLDGNETVAEQCDYWAKTALSYREIARAALAEAEKGESELVEALTAVTDRLSDYVSEYGPTPDDQEYPMIEGARALVAKHATPEHAKKG